MIHIDDEILNRYIDNELSSSELVSVNEHLKECDECLIRLKALRVADTQLKRLELSHVSADFTANLMGEINKVSAAFAPKKFYFFRFIFSLFVLIILTVLIIAITSMSSSLSSSAGVMDYVDVGTSYLLSSIKSFMGKINISLLGTVISFIFFISMYLIYDSHRRMKHRLEKL